MARKAEGLSRRRIEAGMRVVDGGTVDKEVLRDATVRGLSLAIGRATQRWALEYKAPLPGGGRSGGRRMVLGDLADMNIEAARAAALAARPGDRRSLQVETKVEAESLPAGVMRALLRSQIESLLPEHALKIARIAEASERRQLQRVAEMLEGTG